MRATESSSENKVTVVTRFRSTVNCSARYDSIEDFWADHEILMSDSPALESAFSTFFLKRKRVKSGICNVEGTPYYVVVYKNKEHYLKHISFLKRLYKFREKKINSSETHFYHDRYVAIDTITQKA